MINCPRCNSTEVIFLPKKEQYFCQGCMQVFERQTEQHQLRVFVSYGHDKYLPFAQKVAQELEIRGHEVWFDEKQLKPGRIWESYIEQGLNWVSESKLNGRIILIMTPYSVRRPDGYCLNEIAKALDNKITIIPVMLVWAEPPLSIYRLQWLDLQNSKNKTEITESFQSDFYKICTALEQPNDLDATGTANRLMKELEPLDFSADLVFSQAWFTGRQWVFDEIEKWINDRHASRLFWLAGAPGIGKTTIATRLLQLFPNIVAFHLCKRGHSEKASPHRAICTIAYQLSTQLPDYRDLLLRIDIEKEIRRCNDVALFDILIVQPLCHIIKQPQKPLIILIDGLDEASLNGHNSMALFIASEFYKLPEWLRIIITSRLDKEVTNPFQVFDPWVLESESKNNTADLVNYIGARLGSYVAGPAFDLILNKIIKRSEGSFLYTKYLCDMIVESHSFDLNAPNAIPQGLAGVYQQYFHNKFPDKHYYRENIRPALQVMIASYECLTAKELKGYLGWTTDKVTDFLLDIGSFIIENNNSKLITYHSSFFYWLVNKKSAGDIYWINKKEGAIIIGDSMYRIWSEIAADHQFIDETNFYQIRADIIKKTGKTTEPFFNMLLNALSYYDTKRFIELFRIIHDSGFMIYDDLYRNISNCLSKMSLSDEEIEEIALSLESNIQGLIESMDADSMESIYVTFDGISRLYIAYANHSFNSRLFTRIVLAFYKMTKELVPTIRLLSQHDRYNSSFLSEFVSHSVHILNSRRIIDKSVIEWLLSLKGIDNYTYMKD